MHRKMKSMFWDFPCPSNLNLWWTFGSMSGLCLVIQIFSGLMLSLYYEPSVWTGHYNVLKVAQEAYLGWVFRGYHMMGASFFFVTIYLHIARSLYYGGYEKTKVWLSGFFILIILMAIAFLGYVLPWGQMSYWGCTVITNLFSVIPHVGEDIVKWLWGGTSVGDPTLKRFYVGHMLLPFSLVLLVLLHLHFLHQVGSSNPLGCLYEGNDVPFHPTYSRKDAVVLGIMFGLLSAGVFFCPYSNSVPENWEQANPMLTPEHIEPEWYFLWLYAILRSVPNKEGGVVAMFGALLVISLFPALGTVQQHKGLMAYTVTKALFFIWVLNILALTYLGSCSVTTPTTHVSLLHLAVYFLYYFLLPVSNALGDKYEILKSKKYRNLGKDGENQGKSKILPPYKKPEKGDFSIKSLWQRFKNWLKKK